MTIRNIPGMAKSPKCGSENIETSSPGLRHFGCTPFRLVVLIHLIDVKNDDFSRGSYNQEGIDNSIPHIEMVRHAV
jgi:hypothetical protein